MVSIYTMSLMDSSTYAVVDTSQAILSIYSCQRVHYNDDEAYGSNPLTSFDPPADPLRRQQRWDARRGGPQSLQAGLFRDASAALAPEYGTWRQHCGDSYIH